MAEPNDVRIITTLGHVDHGKTTLMDALLAANNIISSRMAGKLRYLDSREDEQERGITMESSAVSLKFTVMEKNPSSPEGRSARSYLVNMIDTPGHVDFSSEVSTASRLCDGALILVDVVEGVCTQTIAVLRQAWQDRLKPILVINKFDRLITELKLAPVEAYHHLSRLIEQNKLRTRPDAVNETDEFQEKDDEDIYFAPEKGNLYATKLGMKEANLRRVLWGDFYLDPKTKRFVLENIWAVYDSVSLNPNPEKTAKIVSTLNLKILPRDLKSKDTQHLISLIFSQWLSLSTSIIQAVIDVVPPPAVAQKTRIPKIIYPDLYEATLEPKNRLETDLYASKSGPGALICGYVSKMFSVPVKDLPENKKKGLKTLGPAGVENDLTNAASRQASPSPAVGEVLLGFARLYSGSLQVGSTVHVVLPKFDTSLGPKHPRNAKFLSQATVQGLYTMMGRELVATTEVKAGNICAIRGLEGVSRPIVRVALEPAKPSDMPKLIMGMKLLSQADPCVEMFQQKTGEYVILTAGRIALGDLTERFAKIEIQPSKPIVPFRETAVKAPDMSATKTQNAPRGTIHGHSSNNLVRFSIRAVPLPSALLEFILDNASVIRRLEKRVEDDSPEGEDDESEAQEDNGGDDIERKPTVKIETFWEAWEEVCTKANASEWKDVWCFGPTMGGCVLVDARKGEIAKTSLKQKLTAGSRDGESGKTLLKDLEKNVETGFQLAVSQGPLCAEPVQGLGYFVERIEVDEEHIAVEIEQNRLSQITGSLISGVRDACRNGLLDWSPRLMLAMYSCDIQCSTEVLGKVYGVVAKRRGRIVAEEMKEGTSFFTVSALLPVVESFGFADDIRKRTSGAASPQLIFSGYELLDQDPFWVPTTEEELEDLGEKADRANMAKAYMDAVRERKGMFVDKKIVEFAEKQRTLKR
ncbi:translation elongation factor 2 [Flagelloscypha sp. PMI_526]|nr:translation elongation factor 2 [Flagelloscypha sp. PMI_526]